MGGNEPQHCTQGGTGRPAASLSAVPLYFFDTRDGDDFVKDDDGVDLLHLEQVKTVAAKSLADLARDVLPSSVRRKLVIEVRDERGPVLMASLTFEAVVLVPQ
jgi:hypothetical protein